MIADIYGKISKSGSNLSETLEDKLTGDIFGAFRYISANMLLIPFFRKAYWINPKTNKKETLYLDFSGEPKMIFWPRKYAGIEPDIEILFNQQTKMFVEVKYKSGLSGDDNINEITDINNSNNQLIRQIRVLSRDTFYNQKILVYLTEDGSYPYEIMDRVSTITLNGNVLSKVRIYWLSWHNLTSIAQNLLHINLSICKRRLVEDIVMYCQRKSFHLYEYYNPMRSVSWKYIDKLNMSQKTSPYSFKYCCQYSLFNTDIFKQSAINISKYPTLKPWRFCNE